MSLNPPYRFAMVQEDVFRGAWPKPRNTEFLKTLNLTTILSLTPEPLELKNIACRFIHIAVEKPKDSNTLTYAKINQILALVVDRSLAPIYVHGLDGIIITSKTRLILHV